MRHHRNGVALLATALLGALPAPHARTADQDVPPGILAAQNAYTNDLLDALGAQVRFTDDQAAPPPQAWRAPDRAVPPRPMTMEHVTEAPDSVRAAIAGLRSECAAWPKAAVPEPIAPTLNALTPESRAAAGMCSYAEDLVGTQEADFRTAASIGAIGAGVVLIMVSVLRAILVALWTWRPRRRVAVQPEVLDHRP